MPLSSANSLLQANGTIHTVDTLNRELQVRVAGVLLTFDVPPDCAVLLNDERVKLRLLQATDDVRVFYRAGPRGLHTAQRVEAQAGTPSASS